VVKVVFDAAILLEAAAARTSYRLRSMSVQAASHIFLPGTTNSQASEVTELIVTIRIHTKIHFIVFSVIELAALFICVFILLVIVKCRVATSMTPPVV
jgi:hypothetical protein